MSRDSDLEAKTPPEAGVPKESPPAAQVEGAHLLASQAHERLADRGFTFDQVDQWAQTYIAEEGSGDVARFIAWIEQRESA